MRIIQYALSNQDDLPVTRRKMNNTVRSIFVKVRRMYTTYSDQNTSDVTSWDLGERIHIRGECFIRCQYCGSLINVYFVHPWILNLINCPPLFGH